MESTSSTAHVEPKQKSQDPAAKAKRLKKLLTNPDFAEAVEFERSIVKKYKQHVAEVAERRAFEKKHKRSDWKAN